MNPTMTMDEVLAVVGSQFLELTALRKTNAALQQKIAELTKPAETATEPKKE